ncbi:hypothetical protein DIPPA_04706 [Diplonema papillatum]|nr:hypothetical protein DIPPA_04706 [Diplonema papillatum]
MSGVVGYGGLYTPGPPGAPEMTEEELVRRLGDVLARSVQAIRSDSKDNRLAIWRSVQKEVAAGYILARLVRRGLRLPLCQYYDDFAAPTLASDDRASWNFSRTFFGRHSTRRRRRQTTTFAISA